MVEFAQGNSNLSREINQRHGEGGNRDNEEDGDAALVLHLKECAHKRHDDQNADRDACYH